MEQTEVTQLRSENASLRAEIAQLKKSLLGVENGAKKTEGGDLKVAAPPPALECVRNHDLDNDQVSRYSRHLILRSFGVEAQERLCQSSVLVIGAGGLGSPACLYLACAGIGRLGIVDKDTVELNNLHRQIIHRENLIGMHKADSAAISCKERNSSIKVEIFREGLLPHLAVDLIKNYDVVIDASDNVPTRYLASDACVVCNKPLISGAAIGTDGQLTVYNYGEDGPCYRCLFPEPPAPAACSKCSDAGVLGPVPGAVGVLQALEAIKLISKVGDVLHRKLLVMDFLSSRFHTVRLRSKVENCVCCGKNPQITAANLQNYDYMEFTGQPFDDDAAACLRVSDPGSRLRAVNFNECLGNGQGGESVVLDVRPECEFKLGHLQGSLNFPWDDWDKLFPDILSACKHQSSRDLSVSNTVQSTEQSTSSNVYVVCRRGNDSQLAVKRLKEAGVVAKDLVGGLTDWAQHIDASMPNY